MNKTTKWIFVIIGILLIPAILNFFLQIQTGLIILGGSESTASWLSFWGSFLSAIAAGFLGWVSLKINEKAIEQNKISIEQNDKILHNDAWNKMVAQYNKLEDYIITQEQLHSLETIQTIKILYLEEEKKIKLETKIKLLQIKAQLREASIKINRFGNDGGSSDGYREINHRLSAYGKALYEANQRLLEYTDFIYNSMISHEERHEEKYEKIYDHNQYQRLADSCTGIMNLGFNYLQEKKNEIVKFAKEHNIEQGAFI